MVIVEHSYLRDHAAGNWKTKSLPFAYSVGSAHTVERSSKTKGSLIVKLLLQCAYEKHEEQCVA